jgi:thiol-disulfide isomerase/thioredoxin
MKPGEKTLCFYFLIIVISASLFYAYKNLSEQGSFIENFENAGDEKLTLFHWNNCGHCKNMMPDWDKLEKAYPNQTAKYEKDEISEEQMSEFKINGYPTICIVKDGKKYKDYEGGRTYDEMEVFLKENISSPS